MRRTPWNWDNRTYDTKSLVLLLSVLFLRLGRPLPSETRQPVVNAMLSLVTCRLVVTLLAGVGVEVALGLRTAVSRPCPAPPQLGYGALTLDRGFSPDKKS